MRVVLWIGKEPNQIALLNKISKQHQVLGVVLETKQGIVKKRKLTLNIVIKKVIERILLRKVAVTWKMLMEHYKKHFVDISCSNIIEVTNINSKEVIDFTNSLECELILVSGTLIIKKHMFLAESTYGIINLHTGLSPYIKGGPNCTNWCIATRQFHLIGNSVMWLNEGIDSGELILTECTKFDGNESFFEIHLKVMEHAHELYLKALKLIESNEANRVNQDIIGCGTTYYTRDWGLIWQIRLCKNLKQFSKVINSNEYKFLQEKVVKVDLKN
ncbi:MAG: hypothetical protein KDD24_02080 [Flavobacteriales bacterium]|nr:hypothetical protein [Flavobacteriales bacterium]MCB9173008.1 hypothetical protein [Flavobacteriales bacterium]